MSDWGKYPSVVALLAILCACGEGKESRNPTPRAKEFDPMQAACIESVMKRHTAQNAEFTVRHIEALKLQRSSIDITLEQRRANEQLCLEYAQCLALPENSLNEIMVSAMFDSCLREREREI